MRSRSRSPPSRPRSSRSSRHHEPQSSSSFRPNDRDRFGRSESRRGARGDHHNRDQLRREREHSPNERVLVKERPRSRSIERRERHPRYDRDRGGERLRERDRRDRDRRSNGRPNDRNGSPTISRDNRRRTRSRSHSRSRSPKSGAVPKFLMNRPEITDKDLEGKTEDEKEMMKLMGFAGFDTTKGKPVQGNNVSAVNVLQKRKYRQYMNRKGGFNRPLDFVA